MSDGEESPDSGEGGDTSPDNNTKTGKPTPAENWPVTPSGNVDYTALEPPKGKNPLDYTPHERRAEILDRIFAAGGPHNVNQTRLAERYGVHNSTISRDIDRLAECVGEGLGRHLTMHVRTSFTQTVEALRQSGDDYQAWRVVMEYSEWLADRGIIPTAPKQIQAEVAEVDRTDLNAEYRVLRPDEVDDEGAVDPSAVGFAALPGSDSDPERVDAEQVDDAPDDGGDDA